MCICTDVLVISRESTCISAEGSVTSGCASTGTSKYISSWDSTSKSSSVAVMVIE